MLGINVPKPSQWIKHSVVEQIATECSKRYRELQRHPSGFPVNVRSFADLDLEITIEDDDIEEPEGTVVFAKICQDTKDECRYIITVNTRYKELFELRPDLLRACLAHEVGHFVLRHHMWHVRPRNITPLFQDIQVQPRCLHDSSLRPFAFTRDELNDWCKRAFKGDDDAREKLLRLQDRLEPEWMFWQAERFAACFLVPRDRLIKCLNDGWEVSSWLAIRRLAEHFDVSPSLMRVRLTKLGAIVIENGKPKIGTLLLQPKMLRV
jgi:Zn-dependent peptidase ImmA (M78 family)